jgi:hypothetical protein
MSTVCRNATSASVPNISRVCFPRGWISTWGSSGLWGGVGAMTWRRTSAVIDSMLVLVLVMTSGGCCDRLALDPVESALYLISTSRCNFRSIATAMTEVPGSQCVSANNLPRS